MRTPPTFAAPIVTEIGWLKGSDQAVGIRYYNSVTGRYISRDPIGYGDGPNVYLYVKNNPINRIDPLGLGDPKGHHVVPVSTWKNEKLQPGVQEIYEKATLSDPAYKDHNTRSVPVGDPEGKSAFKYNDAVKDFSKEHFGKLPHELNAKQAQELVDRIMAATVGEPKADATEAEKVISKYNKAIKEEIRIAKDANAKAPVEKAQGEKGASGQRADAGGVEVERPGFFKAAGKVIGTFLEGSEQILGLPFMLITPGMQMDMELLEPRRVGGGYVGQRDA